MSKKKEERQLQIRQILEKKEKMWYNNFKNWQDVKNMAKNIEKFDAEKVNQRLLQILGI